MNMRYERTKRADRQFYSLPIELQTPLDDFLTRRAGIEADRHCELLPGAAYLDKTMVMTLDLGDGFWNEITAVRSFDPGSGVLEILAIGYKQIDK